jgi:hypothetical protein
MSEQPIQSVSQEGPQIKTDEYDGDFPGSVSGTYLSVRTDSLSEADYDLPVDLRYSVLYLLPKGYFAWFDYWSGFHYGRHAGQFIRRGAELELRGEDALMCDMPDLNHSGKPFYRRVQLS